VASIASLVVSMIADTGSFSSDMERASKQQTARFKKMEKDAATAGKAIAVAFTVVSGAAVAMVAKTIGAAEKIYDLSVQTGISAEALSQFSYIAEQSGASFDTLTGGISKMQRSLISARDSTSGTADMFSRLGLSIDDLLKLTPDKQFEKISGAISGLGNAAERTAAAQAIFGRSGADLLPVMALGEEGIRDLGEEFRKTGAVISTEFARDADAFGDNLGKMKSILTGVANQVTAGLLPSLISMQEEFIESGAAADIARSAGELLGSTAEKLAGALKFLAENAELLQIALGGYLGLKVLTPLLFALGPAAAAAAVAIGAMAAAVYIFTKNGQESQKILTDLTQNVQGLTEAYIKSADAAQLAAIKTQINKDLIASDERLAEIEVELARLREQAPDDLEKYHGGIKLLVEEQDKLNSANTVAAAKLSEVNKQLNGLRKVVQETVTPVTSLGNSIKKTEALTQKWTFRQSQANKMLEDGIKAVEEIEQAQEEYNERLQELNDIADPIGAVMREFGEQLEFANQALAKGAISAETYQKYLNSLSNQLGQTVADMQAVEQETTAMSVAVDESIRILERAFTDMWSSIGEDGLDVFDTLKDGFKTLLGSMVAQLSTSKITEQLRNLFDVDPKTIFNSKEFLAGLAGAAGVLGGTILGGGGQNAGIGAQLGALAGSFAGPIGTAIGGVLGGLLGGLFDKDKPAVLQASSFDTSRLSGSDNDTSVESIFGKTFIRTRRLDQAAINSFKDALADFDNSIGSFLDESQITKIAGALEGWSKQIEGETLSAEELLNSRFKVILSTFSDDLQKFVNQAKDLEEQAARLQIGVGAEKLFADQPDLFGSRTVKEFLTVVDAFKTGTESISDAFKRVVELLDTVIAVKTSLADFASSDLAGDFNLLLERQAESVVQTVTRMVSDLAGAMVSFDGSPEQLVQIGNLALSVRQQELTALALIDSVAKGLNANLDRLRKDTEATINGPRAAEDILFDARALIAAVSTATTPEGIAQIAQEFEALIRSLSPEDTKAFGTSTLAIIDAFQAASQASLDRAEQAVLESGEAIRKLAEGFGLLLDPLEIVASTNERAAAALELLAGVTGTSTVETEGYEEQARIISDGIDESLTSGVSNMAAQLANAIRTGFATANVSVNVVMRENALVNR